MSKRLMIHGNSSFHLHSEKYSKKFPRRSGWGRGLVSNSFSTLLSSLAKPSRRPPSIAPPLLYYRTLPYPTLPYRKDCFFVRWVTIDLFCFVCSLRRCFRRRSAWSSWRRATSQGRSSSARTRSRPVGKTWQRLVGLGISLPSVTEFLRDRT